MGIVQRLEDSAVRQACTTEYIPEAMHVEASAWPIQSREVSATVTPE